MKLKSWLKWIFKKKDKLPNFPTLEEYTEFLKQEISVSTGIPLEDLFGRENREYARARILQYIERYLVEQAFQMNVEINRYIQMSLASPNLAHRNREGIKNAITIFRAQANGVYLQPRGHGRSLLGSIIANFHDREIQAHTIRIAERLGPPPVFISGPTHLVTARAPMDVSPGAVVVPELSETARDYLATIERAAEALREFGHTPINIGENNRFRFVYAQPRGSSTPMDKNYPHECASPDHKGHPQIWWKELVDQNWHICEGIDNNYKYTGIEGYIQLKKLWRSKVIQFYCCRCYNIEMRKDKGLLPEPEYYENP